MFPEWVWASVRSRGEAFFEPRGWDVGPGVYRVRPAVSDVAGVCPTGRDVWLRRVARVRVDGGVLLVGRVLHGALLAGVRAGLYRGGAPGGGWSAPIGLGRIARSVFELGLELGARARGYGVPVAVEPAVPGAPVGLSDAVRPDMLVGPVPVEVVLARGRWAERKRLAIAGYALAVEAWLGVPVDYGVILGLRVERGRVEPVWRLVWVTSTLREEFLQARDMAARILQSGTPPEVPPSGCPKWCPFKRVCRSVGVARV